MNADPPQYTDKVLLACHNSTECNPGTRQLLGNRYPLPLSHTRDMHRHQARRRREISGNLRRAEATPQVSMIHEGRHLPSHRCMAIQRQTQETCSFGMQEIREIIETQEIRGIREIRGTLVI